MLASLVAQLHAIERLEARRAWVAAEGLPVDKLVSSALALAEEEAEAEAQGGGKGAGAGAQQLQQQQTGASGEMAGV